MAATCEQTIPATRSEMPLHHFLTMLLHALLMAAGMMWQTGWSLMLGFTISGTIRAVVPTEHVRRALGRAGFREIAFATLAGIVSSSCSYAAAAVSRTLFKKGAALVPALAFLFASTNLVIELGIILFILMGWQFTLAEWLGGIVLIAIMTLLVRFTYPAQLVERARRHQETGGGGHEHGDMTVEGDGILAKLANPQARIAIAQNIAMDWSMLWKDLIGGFLIAGAIAAFVPGGVWHALFVSGADPWLRVPANALLGPLVAVITFVCSIGNVPLAAVLWSSGIGFGGVLAFLYADLLVLPLLDVYRRYYGLKMAAYIAVIFYATMVLAALVMDLTFNAAGAIPAPRSNVRAEMTDFSLNYTFWLNLVFGLFGIYVFWINRRHPMDHHHHHGHHGAEHDHAGHDHHHHAGDC